MTLSRSTLPIRDNPAPSSWSLWLLLTGLLAFGGFVVLPALQATLPATVGGAPDRLLVDEWQEQRWLVGSRALLETQATDQRGDVSSSPPSDAVWLAVTSVLQLCLSAVGSIASLAKIALSSLPLRSLSGAPRGPPAALV